MGHQPVLKSEKYSVQCEQYQRSFWPWREDRCYVVTQRHPITADILKTFDEPIEKARNELCRGEWFQRANRRDYV